MPATRQSVFSFCNRLTPTCTRKSVKYTFDFSMMLPPFFKISVYMFPTLYMYYTC